MSTLLPVAPAQAGLRLFRPANPATGLGLAVSHLMGKPAFAALRFGAWSRVLVGQVNRGHYALVVDGPDRIVGFLGWALTSESGGDSWLAGRDFVEDSQAGDCIVFNAWSADTPEVHVMVLDAARRAMLGRRLAYFKRHYPGRGTRAMRMPINAFVGRHLDA